MSKSRKRERLKSKWYPAAITIQVVLCIASTLSQPGPVSDEAGIREVLDRQAAAWNAGDLRGYMEGYWSSDSLLFTSGGRIQRGWQETYEKYSRTYETREKMGILKFSKLEIRLLSSHAAWVFGNWELLRGQDYPHGVFTLVFRKFPSGWKIIHDHTSSSPALDSLRHSQ